MRHTRSETALPGRVVGGADHDAIPPISSVKILIAVLEFVAMGEGMSNITPAGVWEVYFENI